MARMIEQAVGEIDEATTKIADASLVEEAWALRGFTDGVMGFPPLITEVSDSATRAYVRGHAAGQGVL